MLHVVAWKWRRPDGSALFSAIYVNRLRDALERHLDVPHELVCVTDDPDGIARDIRIVPLPDDLMHTPRCRRRLRIFDRAFARQIGTRILQIDLDMVITGNLTPLVDRREPLVGWRVDHANVLSGSLLLMNAGVLHGLWQAYADARAANREGEFWTHIQSRGIPSDQAALNWWLTQQQPGLPRARWQREDGIVTYYGAGYERLEHLGVGPHRPDLPTGTRLVVLGSDDLADLESGRYAWAREHWGPPLRHVREVSA